ncbi:hypothetical protein [Nonomuraea sp. NPDC049400]|uniref:rhamnogalacturonan lyase family protein n=1 Tax=Nonomuraea sp. NPDC049400 TaxID=3364352 RepID=UPI0037B25DDA
MRLALIAAAVTLTVSATPAVAAPLDPAPGLKFDFGSTSSPLAEGYTRVAHNTLYTADLGYGLDRAVGYRDRGTADPVTRDFTVSGSYGFAVDVPNGEYELTVISGDAIAPNATTLAVEGEDRGTITASTGAYGDYTGTALVADGRLDLAFGRDGRVNAVLVKPATAPTGLAATEIKATATPSVTLAWNATGTAGYEIYRAGSTAGPWTKLGGNSAPAFTDSTPELGLTYVYAVAVPGGTLGAPLTVTVKDATQPAPAAPESLELVTASSKKITLRWRPVEGALLYHLYRDDKRIGVVTEAGYTDEIVPSDRHRYRVVAAGTGGLSASSATLTSPVTAYPLRRMAKLDRGLVAVPTGQGTLVSWRMLGTDPAEVSFKLYRDGKLLTTTGKTNYLDSGTGSYTVAAVLDGRVGRRSAPVRPWAAPYLDIPLDKPTGGVTPSGGSYDYRANDAAAADLDGDGQYEIVLKWDPSNSKDNSQGGYTGAAVFDAYELDGTRLWRINLGRNVRAGAHYSPFLVDDFDGDGRAEFVVKTADGTVDGAGTVIGDAAADHRTTGGRILSGPEYLTVFDGRSGAALATVDYEPARGNLADWGDTGGNRSDRFLAAAAHLDGVLPSIVMTRGYYAKTMLVAYDWRGGKLTKRWTFSSSDNPGYGGQGNHNLSVADVDGDGRDEIAYGAMTLDDDGTGLYTTKLEHGDAMHLGDLDPAHPGLEIVGVHEHTDMPCGLEMHDADSGEILWCVRTGQDTGRGLTGDIDPAHPGEEAWASTGAGLRTATGELISAKTPAISNSIWWDGDLSREILDHDYSADKLAGVPTIGKWDPATQTTVNMLTATGAYSNNTTKGNPSLQADLLGDWREELIVRTEDSTALRLYSTPYATDHRFPALMHDPVYQSGIVWQNVGYNQPPHTAFFLGTGMATPPAPYLTTGSPLQARLHLRKDRLDVALPHRGSAGQDAGARAGILPGTVRAVADGKIVELGATALPHGGLRVDGAAIEKALAGYTGTVTVTVTGHLTDGRTFTGELKIRP